MMTNKVHVPETSLCMACKHDGTPFCTTLDFDSMQPIDDQEEGIIFVDCTGFEFEEYNYELR